MLHLISSQATPLSTLLERFIGADEPLVLLAEGIHLGISSANREANKLLASLQARPHLNFALASDVNARGLATILLSPITLLDDNALLDKVIEHPKLHHW